MPAAKTTKKQGKKYGSRVTTSEEYLNLINCLKCDEFNAVNKQLHLQTSHGLKVSFDSEDGLDITNIKKVYDSLFEFYKSDKVLNFMEYQNPTHSGIYIDVDIKTTKEEILDKLTEIGQTIAENTFGIMDVTLDMSDPQIVAFILTRDVPKCTKTSEGMTYRTGIHIYIPSHRVSSTYKKMILFPQLIEICEGEELGGAIDPAAAYVPITMIGSCKAGDGVDASTYSISDIIEFKSTKKGFTSKSVKSKFANANVVLEGSLLFDSEIVKKTNTEPNSDTLKEMSTMKKTTISDEHRSPLQVLEDIVQNTVGLIGNVNAPDTIELRQTFLLLECLSQERCDDYVQWRKILCAIKNTHGPILGKPLAQMWSKKSDKYDDDGFEEVWRGIAENVSVPITEGTLRAWAKEDNYQKYLQVRETSIGDMMYNAFINRQIKHDADVELAKILMPLITENFMAKLDGKEIVWYMLVTDSHDEQVYKWREIRANVPPKLFILIQTQAKLYLGKVASLISNKSIEDTDEKKTSLLNVTRKTIKKAIDFFDKRSGIELVAKNIHMFLTDKCYSALRNGMDSDPNYMGVGNGIIHFDKKPKLINHTHNVLISMYTSVHYTDISCNREHYEKTKAFLDSYFHKSEEAVKRTFYTYISLALTGHQKPAKLMFLVGNGSNGKSSLITLFSTVFGNYAQNFQMSNFMETRNTGNGSEHNQNIVNMNHLRMIIGEETDQTSTLNTQALKRLTGGSAIGARKIFGAENMQIQISAIFLFVVNVLPRIVNSDYAIWRRIMAYQLKIKFLPEPNPNNEFEQKMRPEAEINEFIKDYRTCQCVLNILIDYYYQFKKQNCNFDDIVAPEIIEYTNSYRDQEDRILAFLKKSLIISTGDVSIADLQAAYSMWHKDIYQKIPENLRQFQTYIEVQSFLIIEKHEDSNLSYIKNVRIAQSVSDLPNKAKSEMSYSGYLKTFKVKQKPVGTAKEIISQTKEAVIEQIRKSKIKLVEPAKKSSSRKPQPESEDEEEEDEEEEDEEDEDEEDEEDDQ